jgi:hypothetical protein
MADYLETFLRAWAFTIGSETLTLLVAAYGWRWFQLRASVARLILGALFASTMTLPYLWFVAPRIWGYGWELKLYAEPLIFAFEAVFYSFYFGLEWKRALLLSTLCNGASLLVGYLFKAFIF